MQKVIIDTGKWRNQREAHENLKMALSFSDYYGANLDALHDELTSIGEKTQVILFIDDKHETLYIKKIVCVFEDSAQENENLIVSVKRM